MFCCRRPLARCVSTTEAQLTSLRVLANPSEGWSSRLPLSLLPRSPAQPHHSRVPLSERGAPAGALCVPRQARGSLRPGLSSERWSRARSRPGWWPRRGGCKRRCKRRLVRLDLAWCSRPISSVKSTARPAGLEPATRGLEVSLDRSAADSSDSQPLVIVQDRKMDHVQPSHPLAPNRTPFGPPVVQASEGGTGRTPRELQEVIAPLLTVRQVAERLGVCTATVYLLIDRGELAHVRVSNAIRVAPIDLSAYIAMEKKTAKRRQAVAPPQLPGR